MVNDTIGDFLARIKNAINAGKSEIELPSSRILVSISEILKKEGFIDSYEVIEDKPQAYLVVQLRYVNGESVIRDLKRISKPGRRIYKKYQDIVGVKRGLGLGIYSTPEGVITSSQAVKIKTGGEYLCEIY